MTMNREAAALWAEAAKGMAPEVVAKIDAGIALMVEGKVPYAPLEPGAPAPDFTLSNQHGKARRLSDALAQGPVILFFYRGAWCPFCNIQLKHYQEAKAAFAKYGAQLIAVTPETPDHGLAIAEKHRLDFDILHDTDDAVGESYGVTVRVPKVHEEVLQGFGVPLPDRNGTDHWTLPVPGVFIIGQDGVVRNTFVEANYRARAEPPQILAALEAFSEKVIAT